METVLVVGSTGHIGIAAIQAVLHSGRNVLAIVRNQDSAKKLSQHISEGLERVTTVEASVVSDRGVQDVVDKVRTGALPAFQHVFSSVGGNYTEQGMLETTTEELRQIMNQNFESNFFAYRATVPYLLEQKTACSWTICTGGQGDIGVRPLPAMTQGALYSFSYSACKALASTNVRFNEIYLAIRVEVDVDAEQHGVMKSSVFGRVYEKILATPGMKSCRIRVKAEEDVENLKVEQK
ncbi:NAD(P)-binding protein [Lojkania enalia]|uniref:NAD(P)-binding protein n=1 Tax=Lojkania enalia TaxID=147567 RepID=A0A9P4N9I5_9PLEO|nr:NAD(P)-binding protein [Didymosphaeria enalia]